MFATFFPSWLTYAHLLPASAASAIKHFTKESQFLYLYVAAIIVGSALSMDRQVLLCGLIKSSRRCWQAPWRFVCRGRPRRVRGEIYVQGPTATGERSVTGLNLATTIHLKGPFSLLASAGQEVNRRQTIFYSALKLDL